MKPQTIPARQFDLPRFVEAVVDLWSDHEVAFLLVSDDGLADFGTGCLGDDADAAGDTPLEWLQAEHTLFGQFTQRDDDLYRLPGGVEIDVSNVDEADDTFLDDTSTYGFLVRLKEDALMIQTAVLRDVTGECVVTPVDDAGVFEREMVRFVESMKLRADRH
jgi:hypothetical protein